MSPINWGKHITEYKEAADMLFRYVAEKRMYNFLVYPILFLYRHYIELQIKEIVINARLYLGRKERFPRGHDIGKLWRICKEVMQAIDSSIEPNLTEEQKIQSKDIYDGLEKDINALAKLDPSSATRYPVDVDGNPIEISWGDFNFRELPELIERIDCHLGGIATGVYQILSDKEEWLSYR